MRSEVQAVVSLRRRFLRPIFGAALFALPVMASAGFPGNDLFLPMAGRKAGVHPSNWYTAVWIHNPTASPATARVWLLERGTANPAPPWQDVAVAAGHTVLIDNAVEALFGRQVFGALRVTCTTHELLVTSRVYSRAAGAGAEDSVGQDFAGVPASFAVGLGERTTVLGVHQTLPESDSEFRYNFGFVETTGHTVTVRVRAFAADGAEQGAADLQVREWSQRQVAFADHFPVVSTEVSRLEVEVVAGSGRVIAYGSLIANGAQDPTTFEMKYAAPAGLPAGAVMTFDLATCPSGWTELVAARGRALVGLTPGGIVGGFVGAPLADLEERQHTHVVNPGSVPTVAAGDHAHAVGPLDVPTASAGAHTHAVDVPRTESLGVPAHTHTVPASPFATYSAGSHGHSWAAFALGATGDWNTFDSDGDSVTMLSSSNGMDQTGSGTYPVGVANPASSRTYYTSRTLAHYHEGTVPASTTAGGGIHAHDVDPVVFQSASAGTHSHDLHLGEVASTSTGSHFHTVNIPAAESSAAATSSSLPYLQLLVCRKD